MATLSDGLVSLASKIKENMDERALKKAMQAFLQQNSQQGAYADSMPNNYTQSDINNAQGNTQSATANNTQNTTQSNNSGIKTYDATGPNSFSATHSDSKYNANNVNSGIDPYSLYANGINSAKLQYMIAQNIGDTNGMAQAMATADQWRQKAKDDGVYDSLPESLRTADSGSYQDSMDEQHAWQQAQNNAQTAQNAQNFANGTGQYAQAAGNTPYSLANGNGGYNFASLLNSQKYNGVNGYGLNNSGNQFSYGSLSNGQYAQPTLTNPTQGNVSQAPTNAGTASVAAGQNVVPSTVGNQNTAQTPTASTVAQQQAQANQLTQNATGSSNAFNTIQAPTYQNPSFLVGGLRY